MDPDINGQAVTAGAVVGFTVGTAGLILTTEIVGVGYTVGNSVMGIFTALGVAAASGGIVAALVADMEMRGTVLNVLFADLLSSIMFVAAVIMVFALQSYFEGESFLGGLLFFVNWILAPTLGTSILSIGIATASGLAAYGLRQWWRSVSTAG